MDKLKMHTPNLANENFQKLSELFPNAVTETINEDGEIVRAVDADVLRQEISTKVVEGNQERYQFTWPDKRKSIRLANQPITKTLRLNRNKSVGRDGTPGEIDSENIYIEGDNLDALKLLQETYLGKIKMIYIDPPYNTGNDRIYHDDFSMSSNEFIKANNQIDEENNRLTLNTHSSGRFHTNWLNMLFPRLRLAKDLLKDDGVIFISIDDHEVENLKKICNEIFNETNFIAQIIWERAYAPVNLKKHFSESHDYILVYAKSKDKALCHGLPRSIDSDNRYKNPDNDPRGVWQSDNLSVGPPVEANIYKIITPSGKEILPPNGRSWLYSKEVFQEKLKDNRIWFGKDGNGVPRIKRFLSEVKKGITPMTIWKYQEVGHSQDATKKLKELFENKSVFTYPKPVELIKRCIELYSDPDSVIMDFFSGSATTAHALLQKNAEDGGNRQFIMVQLPELTNEKSEAQKAGYETICDIGEERIKRAGAKIKEETGADIDYGFRVFKVDSSNMKDVYYNPSEITQEQISVFTDNIKEDRTPEDLLIQIMLDLGIPLSSKIDELEVDDKKVFSLDDNFLLACFDNDITEETVIQIAKMEPFYAVFRDSSMKDDSVMVNYDQIFEAYSPRTQRKVL